MERETGKGKGMPLKLMYITNEPAVAKIAETYGVDRIWIDLETLGKQERQKEVNSVKSHHKIEDIAAIKKVVTTSEVMVRINPWNKDSIEEMEEVIRCGADLIMLPMWKTVSEAKEFARVAFGRAKTILLLETKEAVECLDDVLLLRGIDEIHIGLNDLHLSYGMDFMFEPLADGKIETLCRKIRAARLPFGFGGIAKLGEGLLPAENVIMEHYRLGSTRAILSRSFCDSAKIKKIEELDKTFQGNLKALRDYEIYAASAGESAYVLNQNEVIQRVNKITEKIRKGKQQWIAKG